MEGRNDLKEALGRSRGIPGIRQVAEQVAALRTEVAPKDKLGWYYRHWKSMSLERDTPTFSMLEWDSQCKADWRVNGELDKQKKEAKEAKKIAKKQAALSDQIAQAESLDDVFPGTKQHSNA